MNMPVIQLLIIFFIGVLLGMVISGLLHRNLFKPSGDLVIDTTDEEVDRYSIMISVPIDSLPKKKMISLRIVNCK